MCRPFIKFCKVYILVSMYVCSYLFSYGIVVPSRLKLAVFLGYWEFGCYSDVARFFFRCDHGLCMVQFWHVTPAGLVLGLIQPGCWQHLWIIVEFCLNLNIRLERAVQVNCRPCKVVQLDCRLMSTCIVYVFLCGLFWRKLLRFSL